MKGKFIRDFSANTMAVSLNQFCGLAIFYLLSAFLLKQDFGEINWSLAILLTCFTILSFGLDQVVVKKIAAGNHAASLLTLYAAHVLMVGFLFYGLLLACYFIFPVLFNEHHLLLVLGIGKFMIFLSIPFKQLATGLEKFRPLFFMTVCSNVFRLIVLTAFAFLNWLDLKTIIIIFVAGDVAELLLCLFIGGKIVKINFRAYFSVKKYVAILKESLPQFGVVIFASAMARFDWILLGILAGTVVLAEYSFAYKVYEVATLPLLIIAPILIPRFTKLFQSQADHQYHYKLNQLFILLRLEIIAACCIALGLNILWEPVINFITDNNYGTVNSTTILILSLSMPFIYFNNFLWTINFTQDRLRLILIIYGTTFFVNLIADFILIPFLQAEGAAFGYLLAIIVQSLLFLKITKMEGLHKISLQLLLVPVIASGSWMLVSFVFISVPFVLISSLLLFLILLFFSRVFHRKDLLVVKAIVRL
jgi:O-antigen/teichoic acid export membrane protein